MSGYTRDFDAKFDPQSGRFEEDRKDNARPRFWMEDKLDTKTDTLTKVEMLEIIVPGESKNRWAGRVETRHKQRFAREYAAWKNNETLPVNGHPLGALPGMNYQLETDLKYLGFLSIEDLARADDQAISQFMGGHTWRKKAQIFVQEQRAKESTVSQKDAIIAEQGEALKALQAQMAELMANMKAGPAEPVRRRRKPNSEQATA